MRVHLGCGTVFVRDFVNVDLPLPHVFLAKERPDLVEKFITDEANYYGRHTDKPAKWRKGPVCEDTVADCYGSFGFLPVRSGTVSEVWSVQVFEHLDRREAKEGLAECRRVLKKDGLLRLDIPDADETIAKYRETGDTFFLRHLFGPRRDVYGSHFHYNRQMLRKVVEAAGFAFVEDEPNIHSYPAIAMKFKRI